MKIAIVIERMDVSRGGRETSTAQITAGLARRGHQVTVICQRASWRCEGVTVRELGRRGLTRSGRMANFVADAQWAIADQGFEIVHAMLPLPGANVYQLRGGTVPAQTAAGIRRRGLLGKLAARALAPLNSHRRRLAGLERGVVNDPNVLCLPVSEMVADELAHYYSRTENVRVIYNAAGVPDVSVEQRADWRQERRFRMGLGQSDVVFLTIATNFELKGVAELIKAFSRWYARVRGRISARLVVVGRERVEGYQRHAGMREVGSEVLFVPPTDEIFRWYAAADACVLLSWYDPCSRVVLEATRWGIPSITTRHNGAAEVLAEGAGVVVESPRDSSAIIAAMDELADPQRRSDRSAACLRVADQLGMDRHVDQLLSVYREVLGRE